MENKLIPYGTRVWLPPFLEGTQTYALARAAGHEYIYVLDYDSEEEAYEVWWEVNELDADYCREQYLKVYPEQDESPLSKVIVVNPIPKSKLPEFPVEGIEYSEIDNNLFTIFNKDLDFYCEIERLIKHLAGTYGDKYEESSKYVFAPKEGLTKEVALWNTSKYLRRYSTTGFVKSEDTKDVLKAIHYLLMENKRKNGN